MENRNFMTLTDEELYEVNGGRGAFEVAVNAASLVSAIKNGDADTFASALGGLLEIVKSIFSSRRNDATSNDATSSQAWVDNYYKTYCGKRRPPAKCKY